MPVVPALSDLTAAQSAGVRAANEPKKLTFYLVAGQKLSETREGDSPKIEFVFRDSVSGTIRQYYPSGKLRHIVSYVHIPRRIKHGVETTWSEDGHLLTRQEYQAGEAQGDFLAYFLDGKVERKVVYNHDRIVSIECFNRMGQPKNCVNEEIPPVYPGGAEGLAANLRKVLAYPPSDLKDNRTGRLRINFTVDTTGAISNVQILHSPSESMQAAVVRCLETVKRFRKPGMQEGRPVAVVMYMEVSFDISKSGKAVVGVATSEHAFFPAYNLQH